jgi:hypothetical protein
VVSSEQTALPWVVDALINMTCHRVVGHELSQAVHLAVLQGCAWMPSSRSVHSADADAVPVIVVVPFSSAVVEPPAKQRACWL